MYPTVPDNLITYPGSFTRQIDSSQGKSTFEQFHHPRKVSDSGTYTQEVVLLLTEQIQRRTAWEHERLLFSGSKEQASNYLLDENNFYHDNMFYNNLQFMPLQHQQKYQTLEKIRSPDLMLESKINDPEKFIFDNKKNEDQEIKKQWRCSCKKSKCLKMYCQCFRNGEICQGCDCCDCSNIDPKQEERKKAVLKVQKKQPTAFINIFKYKGCKCTKSNCQKGYCECFANGLMCGKYCKCIQCSNCSSYRKSKQIRAHQKNKTGKRT